MFVGITKAEANVIPESIETLNDDDDDMGTLIGT